MLSLLEAASRERTRRGLLPSSGALEDEFFARFKEGLTEKPTFPYTGVDRPGEFKVIGRGGFSIVFIAKTAPPDEMVVAVKEIKSGVRSSIVLRELIALKRALMSPQERPEYVAQFVDAFIAPSIMTPEKPKSYYIVTEYVQGMAMSDAIDQKTFAKWNGFFPVLRRLIDTALQGLIYLHDRSIAHRDIKPANIMIQAQPDGTFKCIIIDLGLACFDSVDCNDDRTVGSIEYYSYDRVRFSAGQASRLSLEQYQRDDVWALGACFWEFVTGQTMDYLVTGTKRGLEAGMPISESGVFDSQVLAMTIQRNLLESYTNERNRAGFARRVGEATESYGRSTPDDLFNVIKFALKGLSRTKITKPPMAREMLQLLRETP